MQAFPPRDPSEVQREIDYYCTRFNNSKTEYAAISNIVVYPFKNQLFKWSDIMDLSTINIYGHEFYIPSRYDTILTTIYGDYMKFPPIEKRGVWHGDLFF
jgi:lipopolysaccharide cholinephosphotransferase